jgi:hypothetical protein
MAMKMTYKLDNGLIVPDAYIKIISAGTDKTYANVTIGVYVSEEQIEPVDTHAYIFAVDMTDNAKNIWKQGYEYLKSLDKFADAIDVMEEGQQA